MIKPFFNILLAIIIVSCPIRCQLGMSECCCGEAEVCQISEPDCCCDNNPESVPTAPPVKPVKCSMGICSGATMPDHIDLNVDLQSHPFFALNQVMVVQSRFLLINELRPPDQLPVASFDNSVNVGRLIRCLHSSLTI